MFILVSVKVGSKVIISGKLSKSLWIVLIYESSEFKRCVSSANIVETKFGTGLRLSGLEPAKMTLSGISNFL